MRPYHQSIPQRALLLCIVVTQVVAFERWLLENGGSFPRLEIRRYDPEVRGVHARGEIDPDEVIVEIPLK